MLLRRRSAAEPGPVVPNDGFRRSWPAPLGAQSGPGRASQGALVGGRPVRHRDDEPDVVGAAVHLEPHPTAVGSGHGLQQLVEQLLEGTGRDGGREVPDDADLRLGARQRQRVGPGGGRHGHHVGEGDLPGLHDGRRPHLAPRLVAFAAPPGDRRVTTSGP